MLKVGETYSDLDGLKWTIFHIFNGGDYPVLAISGVGSVCAYSHDGTPVIRSRYARLVLPKQRLTVFIHEFEPRGEGYYVTSSRGEGQKPIASVEVEFTPGEFHDG